MYKKKVLMLFIIITLSLITCQRRGSSTATTTVYVDPSVTTVLYTGTTFSVNISISDVTDLTAWDFKLFYDATILNGTALTEGSFLKNSGNTFFWPVNFTDTYNATYGLARATCTFMAPGPGVNGSGVLATITFNTKALGTALLHLTDTDPINSSAQSIPHVSIDGTVKVVKPPGASFVFSPPSPIVDEMVTFDASASTPNGGSITSYFWDFDDFNTTSTSNPVITHAYASQGTFNVTLTVTDSEGLTDSTWKLVQVIVPTGHDIAVINVTPASDTVYQGWIVNINVTVENQGDFTETFNVTAYYDESIMGIQEVNDLAASTNVTLTFLWNTTEVAPCQNYTIKATADVVSGETETTDNTYVNGEVKVNMLGDFNGDGKIDWQDLLVLARAYGTTC